VCETTRWSSRARAPATARFAAPYGLGPGRGVVALCHVDVDQQDGDQDLSERAAGLDPVGSAALAARTGVIFGAHDVYRDSTGAGYGCRCQRSAWSFLPITASDTAFARAPLAVPTTCDRYILPTWRTHVPVSVVSF